MFAEQHHTAQGGQQTHTKSENISLIGINTRITHENQFNYSQYVALHHRVIVSSQNCGITHWSLKTGFAPQSQHIFSDGWEDTGVFRELQAKQVK